MKLRLMQAALVVLALVPWLAAGTAFVPAKAGVAACTAADAPAQGPGSVDKVINTDAGCDNADGNATLPISGYITLQYPASEQDAVGSDAFSAPPAASGPMLAGDYSITFDRCTGGTATGGSYAVSGGHFPSAPVTALEHPLSFRASVPGGVLTCAYAITGPNIPGTRSFTNDIFVTFTVSGRSTHAATNSVHPPANPPVIPEAPLAIALPLLALALVAGRHWVRPRRLASTEHVTRAPEP